MTINKYIGINLNKVISENRNLPNYITLVKSIVRNKQVYVKYVIDTIAYCGISEYDFMSEIKINSNNLYLGK